MKIPPCIFSVKSKSIQSIVETDPPDILPYTYIIQSGQSQSTSQAKQTSQAKHSCMRSGQKSFIQHAQGNGYCGIGGEGPTGGMLIRHGPPSDFGPYHAIAVVWEAGQGNDDSTLGTRRFAAAPLFPCWSSRGRLGLRLHGLQLGIWTIPKRTLC